MTGSARIIRGDARSLPLDDNSVDLICTSPPFFALRSYTDGGEHYDGQLGAEPTPAAFVDALIECTREMVRVLKPSASLWINLGDKYNSSTKHNNGVGSPAMTSPRFQTTDADGTPARRLPVLNGIGTKSLIGIPWRFALRCIDDLGLILRAEVVWSKPNGLPESVTDRVRRSHEQWFHFVLNPRYYSAVDEIREGYAPGTATRYASGYGANSAHVAGQTANGVLRMDNGGPGATNPLGKLPGSVWTIPTEPLTVPDHLGVDHFAAFPTEWPRRIIAGWSPREVCTACGQGRRPVASKTGSRREGGYRADNNPGMRWPSEKRTSIAASTLGIVSEFSIAGFACACPDTTAPTTPGVVVDPFGGTGTTALVAKALGRHGVSVDLSGDYCRLAEWRTNNPDQLAKASQVVRDPRARAADHNGMDSLFDLEAP